MLFQTRQRHEPRTDIQKAGNTKALNSCKHIHTQNFKKTNKENR